MNHNSRGSTDIKPDIEAHVGRKLDDVERDLILGTLARCGGNRTWAADILGISVRTMRNKLIRYQDCEPTPAKVGRMTRREEEANLSQLVDYDPGRRVPS